MVESINLDLQKKIPELRQQGQGAREISLEV
jgi:hypothetical protein